MALPGRRRIGSFGWLKSAKRTFVSAGLAGALAAVESITEREILITYDPPATNRVAGL
jgi:hypothetical protein